MSKKSKQIILSVLAVVLVVAIAAGGYFLYQKFKPTAKTGEKSITLIVRDDVHGTEEKVITVETDASYLWDVLRENKIAEGEEGEYGIYITSVYGTVADAAANEFWSIYVNDTMGTYGVSEQPVSDGDTIALSLETWH